MIARIMRFPDPLVSATLIKRYKRFLADVRFADGSEVTAHCANPGGMHGLKEPGSDIWLSPARNPARKLKWSWELIRVGDSLVGINTAHPNRLAEEAILGGKIEPLTGYDSLRREVKYGTRSRVDLLLESDGRPPCYVEIKNVHLRRNGHAEFPDAVTKRGAKHMDELAAMVAQGNRAIVLFVVQRPDCSAFKVADDIDPDYDRAFRRALDGGVEALCYSCRLSTEEIEIDQAMPIDL